MVNMFGLLYSKHVAENSKVMATYLDENAHYMAALHDMMRGPWSSSITGRVESTALNLELGDKVACQRYTVQCAYRS